MTFEITNTLIPCPEIGNCVLCSKFDNDFTRFPMMKLFCLDCRIADSSSLMIDCLSCGAYVSKTTWGNTSAELKKVDITPTLVFLWKVSSSLLNVSFLKWRWSAEKEKRGLSFLKADKTRQWHYTDWIQTRI